MILVFRYLVPKGYTGITLFPFVFLKHKNLKYDAKLMNHERIHLRQQLELLVLPFFVWYLIEFLIHYCRHWNWNKAYRSISFEKEAYANESDIGYLNKRRVWSFISYT